MKVILLCALIGAASAQMTVPEIIEATKEATASRSVDMPTFTFAKDMDKAIKEKMIELNAEQTMDALYNMTSSLSLSPLTQFGSQASTFMTEMAVPYGIAILIVVGIFYAITSFVGLILNTKMTFLGLLSDFMTSNMDVFSKENMEAANVAANRMLTDAVYTAIDRMGSVYGNN